ncbi:MAG: hypothetical protein F9K19_18475 [Rhizobiaceae bacterium]|nr:MAG: hypothetical protein F9K19_18475 [Rhizobiaceae bacterium]CAG1001986.1 hypothetical protein RHIZO_02904 [Rhizobiaceae bacterium]
MRITFKCDDAVSGLSRVLDQIRRLGLDVTELSATSIPGSTAIVVELPDVAADVGRTLCDRFAQISGVRGLDADPDGVAAVPLAPAACEVASSGASVHG